MIIKNLRIEINVKSEFPAVPPTGRFLTSIFHPNVNMSTGEICVNTLKADWKPSYGIRHILMVNYTRGFFKCAIKKCRLRYMVEYLKKYSLNSRNIDYDPWVQKKALFVFNKSLPVSGNNYDSENSKKNGVVKSCQDKIRIKNAKMPILMVLWKKRKIFGIFSVIFSIHSLAYMT